MEYPNQLFVKEMSNPSTLGVVSIFHRTNIRILTSKSITGSSFGF